jgi:hypothetical protein
MTASNKQEHITQIVMSTYSRRSLVSVMPYVQDAEEDFCQTEDLADDRSLPRIFEDHHKPGC